MEVTLRDVLAEIRNLSYLFYGYSVIWIIILGYIFTLTRREQSLRQQVQELTQAVEGKTERDT
jgi:CcmD family protein